MYKQQSYYINVYDRLLTDIRLMSGMPLGTPDITDTWVLIEGPLLDKQLLLYLDNRGDKPQFPEWISPLFDEFCRSGSISCLKYLRQLLLFCYKTRKEPTHEQLLEAQASFVDTDNGIDVFDDAFMRQLRHRYYYTCAKHLISRITGRCRWSEIVPHHGPGSVFPSRRPDEKTHFGTIYSTIQELYPYDQYFCPLPSFWDQVFVKGDADIAQSDSIVSRLVAVPKDSRGPRLICVHPSESIWIQQGQRQVLEHAIERNPLTSGYINFTNQMVNGLLAKEASSSQEFVTLDLSEASDRISCSLVRHLFGDYTYKYLSCARATHVQLLNGRLHRLRKWAPMGNALTFPVESLIFWALVRSSIYTGYGENCNQIYVFGDDIIFPTRYYARVHECLVAAGLKVNSNKTFRSGFFRESCGVEAYKGFDITPLRMRAGDIITTQDCISMLDLAKRLRQAGYEFAASRIYSDIRRTRTLPLCNDPNASGIYEFVSYDLGKLFLYEPSLKWRPNHRWAVPGRQVRSVLSDPPNHDWYHVLDSIMAIDRSPLRDRGLEYPLPYTAKLSYGWLNCLER